MFDFYAKRKTFFGISIALMVLALVSVFLFGVNLDIQFSGGAIMNYSYTGDITRTSFESTVSGILNRSVSVQEQENAITGGTNFVVTVTENVEDLDSEEQIRILSELQAAYPTNNISSESVNVVPPSAGSEFLSKSLVALALAVVLMIVYIGFRFKNIGGYSAGVMAVLALLHDVVVAFTVFTILGFSINDNFMAVILTILGYSLNDTIVIYDRIRENRRLNSKLSLPELVNLSLNQSFKRTLMTSVTTVAAMTVVAVVAVVYGVSSILTFAIPMIVGILSGFYSSLCISSLLWVTWQERSVKKPA